MTLVALGCGPVTRPPGWVDHERLEHADREPEAWLTRGRDGSEQHYSPLSQIDTANVDRLGLAWEFRPGRNRGRMDQLLEATPVVVDGVMYLSGPWSVVYALDAATGKERWRHDPKVEGAWLRRSCCGAVNRGVEVWKGKVYVGTLDGYLVALDAATGEVLWRVDTFIDRDADYAITGAPHVAGDLIAIGNSGADFGVRGYVSAYEAETGKLAWRFFTVPGDPAKGFEHPELELAAKTWDPNSAWEAGLGGTVWGEMAYDRTLDLLYVGTGNSSPYPIWFRSPSGGDNLFLVSLIAIKASTGRMAWYYQMVPGEIWDYTATANIILADLPIADTTRRVVMMAPKNGFFYVLDRVTGQLLSAEKFVRVNWAKGIDSTGRPLVDSAAAWYREEPKLVFPSSWGGHNWMPMAMSPRTGLVFIPAMERGMVIGTADSFRFRRRISYQGNVWEVPEPELRRLTGGRLDNLIGRNVLKAWDPVAGRERWSVPQGTVYNGGILATGGGILVQGGTDGHLVVYRASDGERLKEIDLGSHVVAGPATYALDGTQYLVVPAGGGLPGMGLGGPNSALGRYEPVERVLAFKLDGGPVPLPPARVEPPVPEPPEVSATPATLERGRGLFSTLCVVCHEGAAAEAIGVTPNLFRMRMETHLIFKDVVLKGIYSANGMASFSDVLTEADADAIHAYLISQQRELYVKGQAPK